MAANLPTIVTRTITAQNQFSDPIRVSGKKTLTLSIWSSAVSATLTLQHRPLGSSDWTDVANFTANATKIIESAGAWEWRIGCKTGNFSSATGLNVRLAY